MYKANYKKIIIENTRFFSIMCVLWRKSLEIIKYDMGRSVGP